MIICVLVVVKLNHVKNEKSNLNIFYILYRKYVLT